MAGRKGRECSKGRDVSVQLCIWLAENKQEPHGIGTTSNALYEGTGPTKSTKPKASKANKYRIEDGTTSPTYDTSTNRYVNGIVGNWKSSVKQSNKDEKGNLITYDKPDTE